MSSELCTAVRQGNLAEVEELLIAGVNPNGLCARRGRGQGPPPLFLTEDYYMIKLLLDYGANVNTVYLDKTILIKAAHKQQVDIVDLLLSRGIDVNLVVDGLTAIQHIVRKPKIMISHPNIDIINRLVNYGADLNVVDTEDNTPLQIACRYYKVDIAMALTVFSDPYTVNNEGQTLIHSAVLNKQLEVLPYVLSLGLDVNLLSNDYYSPLALCLTAKYILHRVEKIRLLLENGANTNEPDIGFSALEVFNNIHRYDIIRDEETEQIENLLHQYS